MGKKFQEAFKHHKNGNLQEAKKIYEEILEETPNDFNCLHHLGLIAKNSKEYNKLHCNKAVKYFRSDAKSQGSDERYWCELGYVKK